MEETEVVMAAVVTGWTRWGGDGGGEEEEVMVVAMEVERAEETVGVRGGRAAGGW